MPDLIVTTQFASPEPGFCPASYEQLVNNLNQLVESTLPGTFTPYIVQDATPSIAQQSYIWYKTSGGKPVGTYKYYGGLWRKVYTAALGDVKMFSGDPTAHFDAVGLGIPGGEHDGWRLLNGIGGFPDFSDKVPIGAHMNGNSGIPAYSAGWRTTASGVPLQEGGATQVTLTNLTTYRPARAEVTAYEWTATGAAGGLGGPLFGEEAGHGTGLPVTLLPADAGNTTPNSFSILPSYRAIAFAVFVGYA